MRMSDEQIRATVAGMKVGDADKAVVERLAMTGEPEARCLEFNRAGREP